jgi:uncharacterized protein involved in outer membrane biogenesis
MLRVWRYFWITTTVLLGLLILLVLLSFLIISQLDPNNYKNIIETQVSELTGRQLKIAGNLHIELSMQPLVRIENVSFANAPWGRQPQMLSLELLQLKISLLPLLDNKLVIEQLLLKGVDASIETNTDDQLNWQLEKLSSNEPEAVEEPDDSAPFELPLLPIIKQLQLDAIHIYYHDAIAELETDAIIDKLRLKNQGIDKAIIFSADGTINENPFKLSGETDFLTATTQNLLEQGISLRFDADALGITLTVNGKIERPGVVEGINIDLTLDADDLDKSFTAATGQSIYQYLRNSDQPLAVSVSTNFSDTHQGYAFSNIKLNLADSDITGDLSFINNPERPEIIAKFHSDNINLDLLLPEQSAADTKNEANAAVTETTQTNEKSASDNIIINLPDTSLPFGLLKTFDASLEYSIKQFHFQKLEPQTIQLSASLYDGLLQVKQFDLNLEGAPIQSSLTIDSRSETPHINSTLDIGSLPLNSISQQFKIEQLKAKQLRARTLRSKIEVSTEGRSVKSLVLNLKGKASIQLDENDIVSDFSIINNPERPKIVADIHSENIDLNSLLSRHAQKTGDSEIQKPASKKPRSDKPIIELPDTPLPFGLLKTLDAEINYSIKQFRFDEFDPQKIKLDMSLDDGLLQVKQFDFNLEDSPIRSSLTVDSRSKEPEIKTSLDIDRFQLNTIAQQLQIKQIKTGTLSTKINLNTRGDNIKSLVMSLDGKADIRLADVNLEYQLKDKDYIVDIILLKLDFSGINEPFGYEVTAAIDDKPLSLSGYLDSPAAIIENKNFNIKLKLAALKTKLGVEGSIVNPNDIGSAQLDIALDMPSTKSTNREIAHFIPKLKPQEYFADLPLSIRGKLISSPNTYRLNGMQLKVGNNDLSGNIFADLRGEKPFIEANLESQLINLNELLPKTKLEDNESTQKAETPTTAKPEENKKPATRLFSDKPLPALDALKEFDLHLKFTQKKLISNEQTIDNIHLNLTLKDSILKLDPLSIDFSKGTIRSKLELSETNKIHLRFEEKISDLNYGNLMTILGIKEYARGELDAEISLTGEGNSVSEIMASLNGKIRVTTVDGELDASSLKLLSKDIGSFIPFTDTSDRQKIKCGVVQFNIDNGIASSHSMVVNTGAISALGTGKINLANETLSLYVAPRTKRTSVLQLAMVPVNITGQLSAPSVTPDVAGSTISTTKTYANISLTIATGGIWLLAEGMTNKLWDKFIDDTDYCARALAGDKIVPRRINLEEEEKKIEADELSDIIDDDENDW